MSNVHLTINYGGEERFEFVRKTIKVSAPYFTTIRVMNYGPDENGVRFDEITKQYSNVSVVNLGRYYHACITEDLLRYGVMTIPDGEWLMFLDSDWRLPQIFLDNMQKEIDICDSEGCNILHSYQNAHILQDIPDVSPGTIRNFNFTQEQIDKFVSDVDVRRDSYGWPLLQKIDKSNVWFDGILGNHCYYRVWPNKVREVPYMYHMHFRHFDEYAYDSTLLFFSWWYVGHNDHEVANQEFTQNSKEHAAIEALKLRHNCFTSNSLRSMIKTNVEFLKDLTNVFLSFEKTEIFTCKQMYRIAAKYNMKMWNTPLEERCDGVCCRYKEGQIFDL